jgi:signal transduction histidine kinase
MQRPVFKWLLFASCLAVFLTVMAWITMRTLDMERQRVAAGREAQVQERIRLALWRMDSLASTLLIRENSRPPGDYQAFRSPDDLFSSDNREIAKGKALMASPLLGEPPEFVLLHFDIPERASAIQSPQVPTGSQLELANNWYAISPQLRFATERLAKLDGLLKRHPDVMGRASVQTTDQPARKDDDTEKLKRALPALPKEVALAPLNDQAVSNLRELTQRSNVVQQQIATEKAQASKVPMKKSEGSLQLYADSLKKKTDDYQSRSRTSAAPASSPAPEPAAPAERKTENPTSPALVVADAVPSTARAAATVAVVDTRKEVSQERMASAPRLPEEEATTPQTQSGDLKPVWIEDELLLVRTATLDGKKRVQGVWVDWSRLREKLLEVARDLLPQASLSPALAVGAALDPSALVTLPVRLSPGVVSLPVTNGWSPLKRSLALAWICLIIAAVAIGLVLHRAMLLSERRGAFVSAVTHELRTPLTTFQLYSEMLADDMVPDATKRKEYLRTLCDESTRLTHLVENVLAYSRIERGRTAARVDRIAIQGLIARIEPRLQQRAREAGLELRVALPPDVAELSVNVDAMGVEQILFNLVDNACKYAAPASEPRLLHLDVTATATQFLFCVRDHGPGISKQQQKRLFQPFEKSATDAAHSAPGVGLGLALCRRLAREMGGDLTLEKAGEGACFAFKLPRR